MPTIIQPIKESVKSKASFKNPGDISAKPQEKLLEQEKLEERLLKIYDNMNIVFAGTPEFAVPILEGLLDSDFKPKTIITAPDSASGRGQEIFPPPVKIIAQKYGLAILQPKTKDELIAQIIGLKPDLIVTAAYGKIFPAQIINLPKYGSINVHPSLLPRLRGPSPIQFAILEGDQSTGTTIMLMNEKMDEGPILAQQMVKIEDDDTAQSLEEKLAKISAKLLVKTLNYWVILKEMPKNAQRLIYPQLQDSQKATYTKILTKPDGKIIWDKSAPEIERQVRAFFPWPGSFTAMKPLTSQNQEKRSLTLKILKAHASNSEEQKELGQAFLTGKNELAIQTGKGCLLIDELQLEGGKTLSTAEFLNGHPEIIGTILQ